MRHISFALTTEQIRKRTKTVTRRIGWKNLKPGTLLQPIVKGQGLKKGEKVQKIGGPIRVVSAVREPLDAMLYDSRDETASEGFPDMLPSQFVEWFAKSHGCHVTAFVTRIEFVYE